MTNNNNTGNELLTIGNLTFNPDMAVIEWGGSNDEPTAVVTILGVVYDDHGTNSQCWRFKGFDAEALKHEMDKRSYDVVYEYQLHLDLLAENKQNTGITATIGKGYKCSCCGAKDGERCSTEIDHYNQTTITDNNEIEETLFNKIKRRRLAEKQCLGCGASYVTNEHCKSNCPGEEATYTV